MVRDINEKKERKKLKVIVWDPLKERSNFMFSTLSNKSHDFFNSCLIFTPEVFSLSKKP